MPKYEDLDSSYDEFAEDYESEAEDNNKINELMHQKHVETLKFLREVLSENRDLRNRIELLQSEIHDSYEETRPKSGYKTPLKESIWVIEKFDAEMQTDPVIDESIEQLNSLQKEWNIRKNEYDRELNRVDEENETLRQDNEDLNRRQHDLNETIRVLTTQINEIKKEKIELSGKIDNLIEKNKEIDYLKKLVNELNTQASEKNMKLMENIKTIENLNLKICGLEEEIIKNREIANEEINELKILCNKHDNCNQIINNLNEDLNQKIENINRKQIEIERLNQLVYQLNSEVESLNQRLKQNESNMNFKEFISLKRELNALKQDKINNTATPRSAIAASSPTASPLPPLKESMIKKKPIRSLK